jgi:DNA replication and repair protein RecF
VQFESIQLTNFRNYESVAIQLHPRVNVFCGENGSGKTNVLDAIHFLCLGKSYFASTDKVVVRQGTDFFRIEGLLKEGEMTERVCVKMKLGARKEMELSGKKSERLSDFIGRFLCVMIAPDDIHLMLEGSEQRRNFLNNTLVQTDSEYLRHLLTYTALLKQRNSLLKIFAEKRSFDALLLESVTSGMPGPAQYIFEARTKGVQKLTPLFTEAYGRISGQKETCDISYISQLQDADFLDLLRWSLEKDKMMGRTTQGIHKDDLDFLMNGDALKHIASQGQLKSFVLALKMAQYALLESVSGRKPVFLLDDIFDRLDEKRVIQLMKMLTETQYGQIFLSDTSMSRMQHVLEEVSCQYKLFEISGGKVISEIS